MSPCLKKKLLLILIWLFCVCFMNAFAIGREPQKDMQIEGRVLVKKEFDSKCVCLFQLIPIFRHRNRFLRLFQTFMQEGAYTVIFSHIGYQHWKLA